MSNDEFWDTPFVIWHLAFPYTMSFIQKQLGHEGSFGMDLKELRELRGLTCEQLAVLTNIHVSVIQALEEERLEDLKDPVYAERHVRILALALESRPEFFLKKYQKLLTRRQVFNPSCLNVHPTVGKKDLFVASRFAAVLGFVALALLAAGYLFWQAYLLQEPPPLLILSPEDGTRLNVPQVEVRGETAPNAQVTVNGRTAVVDKEGNFNLKFDLPRGLTTLTIDAKRRYGSPVSKIIRVDYQRVSSE